MPNGAHTQEKLAIHMHARSNTFQIWRVTGLGFTELSHFFC